MACDIIVLVANVLVCKLNKQPCGFGYEKPNLGKAFSLFIVFQILFPRI